MNKIQTSTPHFELVIEGIHKFVNDVLNSDNIEQKKKLRETIHEVAKLLQCPKIDESKLLPNETIANVLVTKNKNTELEQDTIENQDVKKIQFYSPDHSRIGLMEEIYKGTKIPVLKLKKLNVDSLKSKSRKRSIEIDEFQVKKSKLEQIKKIELPNEIWLKIMNCLSTKDVFLNFKLVCKNFSALTSDLFYLEISNTSDRNTSQFKSTLKHLKNTNRLKEIRISDSDNPKALLIQAIKSNKNIKSIKVSNHHTWRDFKFTMDIINKLKTFCNGLEHLELRNVNVTAPEAISQVAKIETLKSFTVFERKLQESGHSIADRSFASTTEDILSFASNCKDLEAISICIFVDQFPPSKKEIEDSAMKHALDTFFHKKKDILKKFVISKYTCSKFDECHKILDNLRLCQNVEELFIKHFTLEQSNLIAVTELPKLKTLVLKHVKTDFLQLFDGLDKSNLKYLGIILNDENSIENLNLWLHKMKFPSLERFALAMDLNSEKSNVPEFTLNEFVGNSPKLKSVQLQGISFCNMINENLAVKVCKNRNVLICFETFSKYADKEESDFFQNYLEKNLNEREPILKAKYDNMKSQYLAWTSRNIWWTQALKDMH